MTLLTRQQREEPAVHPYREHELACLTPWQTNIEESRNSLALSQTLVAMPPSQYAATLAAVSPGPPATLFKLGLVCS